MRYLRVREQKLKAQVKNYAKKKQKKKKIENKIKGRAKYRKTKSQTLEPCWGTKVSHLPVFLKPHSPTHHPSTRIPSGLGSLQLVERNNYRVYGVWGIKKSLTLA